jgi:hypothetical protein
MEPDMTKTAAIMTAFLITEIKSLTRQNEVLRNLLKKRTNRAKPDPYAYLDEELNEFLAEIDKRKEEDTAYPY